MTITVYHGFSEQVEHALLVLSKSATSPKTAATYDSIVRRFLSWWQEHSQYTTPASALDGWKQSLLDSGLKFSSINVMLSAARKLFHIMARERIIDGNELASVEQVKNFPTRGQRVGNWLSDDEMRQLLALPDTSTSKGLRDYALLSVALACGLRAFELSLLTWDHIQKVGSTWVIMNLQGKHGRVRTVPIAEYAMNALNAYRKINGDGNIFRSINKYGGVGTGLTRQAIHAIVRDYGMQMDKQISPHDLRRSAAKRLKNRAGIEQTKEFLGHSSVVVTERYLDTAIDLDLIAEEMEL